MKELRTYEEYTKIEWRDRFLVIGPNGSKVGRFKEEGLIRLAKEILEKEGPEEFEELEDVDDAKNALTELGYTIKLRGSLLAGFEEAFRRMSETPPL